MGMTYIPDGSGIDYGRMSKSDHPGMPHIEVERTAWETSPQITNYYPWGWLHDCVPDHLKGWKDQEQKELFLKYLAEHGKASHYHFGMHDCLMCRKSEFNGSLVVVYNSIFYRAPWDVSHYIREHDYNPGLEVVEAVMNGKILDDREATRLLEEHIEKNILGETPQKQSREEEKKKTGSGRIWRILNNPTGSQSK